MMSLAAQASGVSEKVMLGTYNVSFDMNTTEDYNIIIENPSSWETSSGIKFTRYNLSIESEEGFMWMFLTDYDALMLADTSSNFDIVSWALQAGGATNPKIYQIQIDGHEGILGYHRFKSGELLVCASYSPDSLIESGQPLGKLNCRVLSNYAWEITRDALNTLHVETINRDRS
jgi:hypothetical protein